MTIPKGNGGGCAVCPVPEQVHRLEGRALIAERDITLAVAGLREIESRMAEHVLSLGRAVADLQDQVTTLAVLVKARR